MAWVQIPTRNSRIAIHLPDYSSPSCPRPALPPFRSSKRTPGVATTGHETDFRFLYSALFSGLPVSNPRRLLSPSLAEIPEPLSTARPSPLRLSRKTSFFPRPPRCRLRFDPVPQWPSCELPLLTPQLADLSALHPLIPKIFIGFRFAKLSDAQPSAPRKLHPPSRFAQSGRNQAGLFDSFSILETYPGRNDERTRRSRRLEWRHGPRR